MDVASLLPPRRLNSNNNEQRNEEVRQYQLVHLSSNDVLPALMEKKTASDSINAAI